MPHAAPTSTAPTDPAAFLSAPSTNRPPQGAPTRSPTAPFKPSRSDPLNREPTARTGATAPRVAGANASGATATATPARAHDPAPRPGQSVEARSGRCPETRHGALPPGPPPKAAAFGIHSFGCGEGGALRDWPGLPDQAGGCRRDPAARANPAMPLPHRNQREGSKGRCPWRGSKGQRPLVGSRGKAPGLPSLDCPVGVTKITSVAPHRYTTLPPRETAPRPITFCPRDTRHAGADHHR
jgi:hypothetical protein